MLGREEREWHNDTGGAMSSVMNRPIGKKLGSILICIASIGVLSAAVAAFLLFRYPTASLSESDLVEVHSEFSTLSIPREWQQFEVKNGVQFGNVAKDGSSSAVVALLDNGFFQTNLVDAPKEDVKAALEYTGKLPEVGSNTENCTSPTTLLESSDYPKINDTTRELVHKRIECSTPSGKRVIHDTRVVVGSDGYMRGVVLTVRADDWRVNEKVYNLLLDSIAQRKT